MNSTLSFGNMENPEQVLNSNITQEQKNSLMLDYIKDSRINSNTEPFERLLSLGVSPDLTNAQGKSILMMAAEKGSLVLVQYLIEEAKADIQMRDSHNKTALSYALEAATENADVITCLLRFNANPNIQSNDGKTPLIIAVERSYHKTAEALLSRGSNPNYINPRTGDNALHIAARRGDERMVTLLLQYNCDVNKKNKKNETGLELCLNNPRLKDLVQHKLPPQQSAKIVTSNVESSPINNMNVVNVIEQFRQVMHQNQVLEGAHEGTPEENMQETGQTQDQDNDALKQQTAKPDYRRYSHQQQQQQAPPQNLANQQKRASQPLPPKIEREPPKRKYPVRNEALNINRANSNTETAQTEASENTSTTNPLESPMSTMTSSPQRTMGRGVDENSANRHPPQYRFPGDENPYIAQSNSNISQYQVEDMMIQNQNNQNPQYNNRQQQQQNKRMMNVQNQNPNQGEYQNQMQSGEYPEQFSPKPQHIQGMYVNNPPPQMNQMRFNDPQQQMKGNMSPGFYNNQQFLISSPNMDMNANPQQQSNKRKPKGQMSHTMGANNPGNKNFSGPGPINTFPPNQNPNLNLNLNLNISQMQGQHQLPHQNFAQSPNIPYNQRNMEGRQVPVPGLDPQQNQQQRVQGNKFNRNPERSFTDNPSQRGLGSPNAGGFQHPVKNIPSMPNMPEMGNEGMKPQQNDGEKAPENIKMVKGGRPQQQQQYQQQQQQQQYQQYQQQKYQQQQGNIPSGPGNSNIMFTPNSPYTDQRGMINSPQGPNPGMFNVNTVPPHFVQHQQPMNMPVNMGMMPPNLGPNMGPPPNMGGPNHFNAVNFSSPGLPMNRNQQQQQQMMGKQQPMQPMFVFPNGIQRNMSMGSEPPMYYINLTDPIQKENSELQANYQSMCKEMTRQMKDIDKTNIENSELTKNLNECQLNEKSLQERIKEREKVIEELRKKNEELEIVVKTLAANSPFANRQDSTTVTEPLLGGYEVNPAERVLDEHDVVTEFWKHEALTAALCEEVMAFEKSVDEYFEEKKPQFDNLIKLMQGAVREVAADAEFYVYGSFATGLSLPWSDIDIVIKLPQTYYSYTVLDSIENNLKKKKWVEDVKIIKNASIPVLKINCTKQYHNKKIDISIQENKHNGLLCVELVKDYLTMYPPVRPLVLILKQFLYHLNLNDTYIGGLSSYALILMIVYLIQTKEMQNIANPGTTQNLGTLLISFLQTYGFEYDYYNQFLVNPRKIMKQTEAGPDMYFENMSLMNIVHQNPPSIMEPKIIIQDPLSSMNNVGRSTFQIKQIKNAFMAAYFEAFKPCICEVHKYVQDLDSPESKKMIHKCTSIFKRMLSAYPPLK